jgi:hypothetical protein
MLRNMCNAACSIAHFIICIRLFLGKMHSYWFKGIEILQGRRQHGEKVGYCYPSRLEKTLYKWDINVPLVTKELRDFLLHLLSIKLYLLVKKRATVQFAEPTQSAPSHMIS